MSRFFRVFRSHVVWLIALSAVSGTGCQPEDVGATSCSHLEQRPISSADVPSRGARNQFISIPLEFSVLSGCGQFNSLRTSSQGFTRTVSLTARYSGCICTQDIPVRQATYVFKEGRSGTYTLRFEQEPGHYLLRTLLID